MKAYKVVSVGIPLAGYSAAEEDVLGLFSEPGEAVGEVIRSGSPCRVSLVDVEGFVLLQWNSGGSGRGYWTSVGEHPDRDVASDDAIAYCASGSLTVVAAFSAGKPSLAAARDQLSNFLSHQKAVLEGLHANLGDLADALGSDQRLPEMDEVEPAGNAIRLIGDRVRGVAGCLDGLE